MPLLDKNARNILYGAGLGFAFALVLPGLKPIFKDVGRPLAKASIRSGFVAYERSREVLAEWRETLEDLVAEVQADLHTAREVAAAASSGGGGTSNIDGET